MIAKTRLLAATFILSLPLVAAAQPAAPPAEPVPPPAEPTPPVDATPVRIATEPSL